MGQQKKPQGLPLELACPMSNQLFWKWVKFYLLSELNWIWNLPLVHSPPYLSPLYHYSNPPAPQEPLIQVFNFLKCNKKLTIIHGNTKGGGLQWKIYSIQRVSFSMRGGEKIFGEKRIFVWRNKSHPPCMHLLKNQHKTFFKSLPHAAKILLFYF